MREGVAEPLDLTTTDLRIILALGGEGELAGHELSEIMGLAPMNVSRALSALGQRGIVEPGADDTNRRRKPVRLSAEGRTVFDHALSTMGSVARALFADLPARDRDVFARAAQSILARMVTWPDAPKRP
jgi:DNA-binding MarR family transcriptional regulator